MMKAKKPNIFIGFNEVAGRYRSLHHGFQKLGYNCMFITYTNSRFYEAQCSGYYFIDKYLSFVKARNENNGIFRRLVSKLITYLFFLPFFTFALIKYDYFVFSSGKSFFSIFQFFERFGWLRLKYLDYYILKFFNKKTIAQFHGSDSRPPFLNGAILHSINFEMQELKRLTFLKSREVRLVDDLVDFVIDIPPQGYFHNREFILRLFSGLPSSPNLDNSNLPENSVITIVHAPSRPEIKGTEIIEAYIRKLQKTYKLNYIRVENMRNHEVMEVISRADIVIDQMYCDYGLAGLATEASWFRKPTIIGGESVDLWKEILPSQNLPPTIYCDPEMVYNELEALIQSPEKRRQKGQAAYDFVKKYHSPEQVAKNFVDIFEDQYPKGWTFSPDNLQQIAGGYFTERKNISFAVSELVRLFGKSALQMDDKPKQRDLLIETFTDDR